MINIQVSNTSVILLCAVLVVLGFYYFKYMIFYYENKDKLNDLGFISKGYKCEEIPQKGFYNGVEYDYIQINRKEG